MKSENVNMPPPSARKVLDGGQGWIALIRQMGDEIDVVNAARVSFGKMKCGKMDESDIRLMKHLVANRHTTPFEHVHFTFLVHCPIFVQRQWVRHRTASINEISRRYTEDGIELYIPASLRTQSESDRQCSTDQMCLFSQPLVEQMKAHAESALRLYDTMLQSGVCREQARMVLPLSLMTTFWWTIDLHNLMHFLELRDDDHAQREIREYAVAIKDILRPNFPHIFQP